MRNFDSKSSAACRTDVDGVAFRTLAAASLVILAAFLGGCRNIRPLVFTTATIIGVEASAEDGLQQHFIVGVKRFEGAIVPTVHGPRGAAELRGKAYSVFAALRFSTVFLGKTRIVQVFGTGEAAETLAGSRTGLANMAHAASGHDPERDTSRLVAFNMLGSTYRMLEALANPQAPGITADPEAAKLRDELNQMAESMSRDRYGFDYYDVVLDLTSGRDRLELKPAGSAFTRGNGESAFHFLLRYRSTLVESIGVLEEYSGKDPGTFDIQVSQVAASAPAIAQDIAGLGQKIEPQRDQLRSMEMRILGHPTVQRAIDYVRKQLR